MLEFWKNFWTDDGILGLFHKNVATSKYWFTSSNPWGPNTKKYKTPAKTSYCIANATKENGANSFFSVLKCFSTTGNEENIASRSIWFCMVKDKFWEEDATMMITLSQHGDHHMTGWWEQMSWKVCQGNFHRCHGQKYHLINTSCKGSTEGKEKYRIGASKGPQ